MRTVVLALMYTLHTFGTHAYLIYKDALHGAGEEAARHLEKTAPEKRLLDIMNMLFWLSTLMSR